MIRSYPSISCTHLFYWGLGMRKSIPGDIEDTTVSYLKLSLWHLFPTSVSCVKWQRRNEKLEMIHHCSAYEFAAEVDTELSWWVCVLCSHWCGCNFAQISDWGDLDNFIDSFLNHCKLLRKWIIFAAMLQNHNMKTDQERLCNFKQLLKRKVKHS